VPKKKPSLKTQQDLERHLRVYIEVLEAKGYDTDAFVLKEAIQILYDHYYAVLPNAHRMKKAVLLALHEADGELLSVDDLMDEMQRFHLVMDRRRLSMRLISCKRSGEISNPVRGYWRIEKAGRDYVKKLGAKMRSRVP